jgi:hypothetical protein
METPQPVNLSALKNILANAKAVMNKIEGDKPIINSNSREFVSESYGQNQPIYNETDEREPDYPSYVPSAQPTQPRGYTAEQVMASNLPPAIKEAMIRNPIPQLSMANANSTFSLEDVMDTPQQRQAPVQQRRPLTENRVQKDSDMVTISRGELKELINETLVNFLKNNYEKNLTETTIKRTINLLIKEGKLGTTKKTIQK